MKNISNFKHSDHLIPIDLQNEAHIKYENDRLKFALAQQTTNNRKWEDEIQQLKSNTLRLTTQLHDTNSNAEDMKKQLQYYKDECNRLRNNHNMKQQHQPEQMDEYDEVSSTSNVISSFNKNISGRNKLKQELIRLTDCFDKKCKELNDIRDQMRKLINELN